MNASEDVLRLARAYEKYGDELVRFATSLVGPFTAQDVVSQTLVHCLEGSAWALVLDERAFLYRCVLNEVRKHHRAELRRAAREGRDSLGELAHDPDLPSELLAVVASLSPRQRSVVFCAYWLDLDISTTSELLGISEGSVHRHLARARSILRKRIPDHAYRSTR